MEKRGFFSGAVTALTGTLTVTLAIIINGRWIGAAAVTAAAGGAIIPDFMVAYPSEALAARFAALGEAGRAAYLVMNALDFLFAAAYGVFYLGCLGWMARRLFPARPALRWLGLIGVFGAAADEAENVIFRGIANGGLAAAGPLATVASFMSTAKYVLILASMALVVAGLATLAIVSLVQRANR